VACCVLLADAFVSDVVALLQLALTGLLVEFLQLPPSLLMGTGVFLAAYVALLPRGQSPGASLRAARERRWRGHDQRSTSGFEAVLCHGRRRFLGPAVSAAQADTPSNAARPKASTCLH
jgi:hypothetical protein